MLQGNTTLSRKLEQQLAELVNMDHVLLFPTGWAAGFGAITGLVRPNDYVVIDQLGHACLMAGARAATKNVYLFRQNDIADVRKKLRRIREKDVDNAILVVSEGLFSMDSDSPDIATLQETCNGFQAVLMVDVAHDLGAQGPGGTGQIGVQNMLGKVDIVMGSFSKTFSSNGGFVATHDLSVKQFLGIYGGSHTYSNAISPVQCGVVIEAMRIVQSKEGEQLRVKSKQNIKQLRDAFTAIGADCLGEPSNVVPVRVGDEKLAKWTSCYLERNGLIANLVEFPAVARGRARFRFQVMASHTREQIEAAVEIFSRSLGEARIKLIRHSKRACLTSYSRSMIINMVEQEKQSDPALHAPRLDQREEQMAEERSSVGARIIHEVVRKEGEEELHRTTSGLAWSGLAAGLSMGFSLMTEGLIYSMLPDVPWRPLLSKFGYTVGFIVVVLGRQQLFTENTLTPIIPLLARRDASTFKNVLRFWAVVLIANLVGTLIFAWVLSYSEAFSPELRQGLSEIGLKATEGSFGTIVVKGVFAGWLIALMVWLLAGVKSGSVSIIIIITYLVGLGGFAHIIAGSLEAFYLVITGAQSISRIVLGFLLPTLLGNILGGVSLVAALNHAQVVAGGGTNEDGK